MYLLPHGGVSQVAGIDLGSDLFLRGDYPLASESAYYTGCATYVSQEFTSLTIEG